jgi:ABC-2 type transport system ATP-binding protein
MELLADSSALIRLENITKDYAALRALDGVSLDLAPGVIGLLGPNGAGKSTLIKVLLGLVRITRGQGQVLGFRLGRDFRKIRARVGYMSEDDCYVAGLSGVEMVAFAARLSGFPAVEALRRAHEILDFSGIEEERYRAVETYSTGMRQKLKFAQAIVHDPPLLILDEPTAGLDPEEREAMLSRVRVLARRMGKSVLISTHILPDVQAICDTVVILARGRVRVADALETLCRPSSPTYHVRVIGSADALALRIREAGHEARVESDGALVLTAAEAPVLDRLWEWARQAGVGIRALDPARNSLEQIFLDAVREETHADS